MNGCLTNHGRERPLLQAIYFFITILREISGTRWKMFIWNTTTGIWHWMEGHGTVCIYSIWALVLSLFSSLSKDSGRMYNQSINQWIHGELLLAITLISSPTCCPLSEACWDEHLSICCRLRVMPGCRSSDCSLSYDCLRGIAQLHVFESGCWARQVGRLAQHS